MSKDSAYFRGHAAVANELTRFNQTDEEARARARGAIAAAIGFLYADHGVSAVLDDVDAAIVLAGLPPYQLMPMAQPAVVK